MESWDAIIVGAGFSGLGVGALLASAGKKVLLLEKENYIGGRGFSVNYKGHVLDNGPHLTTRAGHLEEIFSRVGKPYPQHGPDYKKTEVYYEGKWQDIAAMLSRQELRKIATENILNASYEQLMEYDDISLQEWVSRKTDNKGMLYFFWMMGFMQCISNSLEGMSAGEQLLNFKEQLSRSGSFASLTAPVIGGLSNYTQPLADAINERGSKIRTGVKVLDVVTKNGQVCGVEVETGERIIGSQVMETEFVEAPLVVSTLPLWDLFTIVSEDELQPWYVDWIETIAQRISNVWTIIHSTDQPIWDELTVRWIPRLPRSKVVGLFCQFPTYGESVGQYQIHFLMQGNYYELPKVFQYRRAKTRRQIRKQLDLYEEDIRELFPELEQRSLWKVRQAAVYSLALAPGLVGRYRPSMKPPGVRNLYIVSDTTREARGVGMQATARAALVCADEILRLG